MNDEEYILPRAQHSSQPRPPTSDPADENIREALKSTRWFAYIAVGIVLAAMCLGLAVMGRFVYLFFHDIR